MNTETMTAEQVLEMEILHNVYIDVDSMTFTHGKREDIYGWRPIPAEWYNRQDKSPKRIEKTTNQKGIKMKLTQEQAREMEILHNVYIDGMMFTHGKRDDIYGWRPIPAEWYNRKGLK